MYSDNGGINTEKEDADVPTVLDFVIAIFYIIFGTIALAAGLMSIF